jgi:hypothetical protein
MEEEKIEEFENEDLEEVNEIEEKKKDGYSIENDPEIQKIREYAMKIEEAVKNNPRLVNRVENKHDFASEVINTNSNQKIANLKDDEIFNLLDKRSFMNFLEAYGWDELARLVGFNINDIENYSLSKEGFLIERAMVENVRQASTMMQVDPKGKVKGGGSNA